MGKLLTKGCYKEVLDTEHTLLLKFKRFQGSGASLEVKAVLNDMGSDVKKKIGTTYIRIFPDKSAELSEIFVDPIFQDMGIGSRMLQFMIDYLRDGQADKIFGTISADDVEKAIRFYAKNGFNIGNDKFSNIENFEVPLVKPQYPQFFELHKVEPITEEEFYRI